MRNSTKPTYEKIRHLSAGELKACSFKKLKKFEHAIHRESYRASLALVWIKGIVAWKAHEENGGKNG